MSTPKNPRLRKLVHPRLQLRLTLAFVGLAFLALTFQFVLFVSVMSETLQRVPGAFADHFTEVTGAYQRVFLISLCVVLPLTALVGVLTTFRVVGPLFNISRFLRRTLSGEKPEDCRLRGGDEYQELCELVNQVTAPLRTGAPAPESGALASISPAGRPASALPAQDRARIS